MTRPAPASRTRAPRRLAALIAALGLLLAAAPPAFATAGSAAVDDAATSAGVTVTVAPGADGVLADGQSLFLTVTAENTSSAATTGGDVTVALGRTPLTTRAEVSAWLDGSTTAPDLQPVATTAFDILPPEGSRTASLAAAPEQTTSADLAAGVYPLQATMTLAEGDTLTSTSVVVIPPDAASGRVALVVPITAPAIEAGLLTSDELDELTAPEGSLRTQLDAVTGTRAILAVDPAIVAAIRVLGAAAPASATEWLRDLLALPNDRFALQFGDADVATQTAAGRTTLLQVDTLTPYLDESGFATPSPTPTTSPTATPSPTPSPGASPGATPTPTLPAPTDTATLLDIGVTAGTVYWPATGTAGPADVAALGTITGVDDESPWVMVPSATGAAAAPNATVGGTQALAYDADVSAALRTASRSDEPAERGAALAAASAFSALAQAADPDGTLLVTIDRAADRTALALRDTISAAGALTGRTPMDFAELTALPAAPISVADVTPDAARTAAIDQFAASEDALAAFATILDEPTLITARERASILQLLGLAWLETPEQWTTALAEHRTSTVATIDSVAIVPPSDQTLLGSSAPMRFTVRNDLPWPVSLVLFAQPADLRLVVQSSTPVTAGPAQNTRVEVPVQSRVANGESSIDLQLRSPTMVPIGDDVTVDVAVRAEWENVGIVVMIVGIAALIIAGIVRTVLRLRRRRHGSGAEIAAKDGRSDG